MFGSSEVRFLYHTQRRTTVGRAPLDEWSIRRRDLYLTTRNTHNRQTSMPPVGFETTIPAGERPQTYTLDRAVTGTSKTYWTSETVLKLIQLVKVSWNLLSCESFETDSAGERVLKLAELVKESWKLLSCESFETDSAGERVLKLTELWKLWNWLSWLKSLETYRAGESVYKPTVNKINVTSSF
jgi:hypothetical protein